MFYNNEKIAVIIYPVISILARLKGPAYQDRIARNLRAVQSLSIQQWIFLVRAFSQSRHVPIRLFYLVPREILFRASFELYNVQHLIIKTFEALF